MFSCGTYIEARASQISFVVSRNIIIDAVMGSILLNNEVTTTASEHHRDLYDGSIGIEGEHANPTHANQGRNT